MRKRLLALVFCAVLVSTVAATSVVSAKEEANTNIRQFDVVWIETGDVVGKLVVNIETGDYVIDANYGKFSHELKEVSFKDPAQELRPEKYSAILIDDVSRVWIWDIGTITSGGNLHGEGIITDKEVSHLHKHTDILTWFKEYGDDAIFWVGFV